MSGIECAFLGQLGQDAEVRTSKTGRNYLKLNIRVGDGDDAQWISALAFDPSAVELAESFTKGARVYCEGRLSTSEWTGADGSQRFSLSVMSWHCRLAQIGRHKAKPKTEKPIDGDEKPAGNTFHSDDVPF